MKNLENNKQIEELIRQKFSDFAPEPPDHVWEGVQKGINRGNRFRYLNTRNVAASVIVLVLLVIGYFSFLPADDYSITEKQNGYLAGQQVAVSSDNIAKPSNIQMNKDVTESNETTSLSFQPTTQSRELSEEVPENEIHNIENSTKEVLPKNTNFESAGGSTMNFDSETNYENDAELTREDFYLTSIVGYENQYKLSRNVEHDLNSVGDKNYSEAAETLILPDITGQDQVTRWKTSFLLSPEFSTSSIDSVEVLGTYSFNVEPTYYLNKHWFIRSGIGLSYARDRGYARINYVTNEYMGSYDDVYDVTFDTVSGNVIPVYHTKKVEIWDSVRHVTVSSVVNKYMFLQVPLLVGYQWKNSNMPLDFYVFAGPAFNFKVSQWIDNPKPPTNDADIISLKNNLPRRSDFYMQMWLGFGMDYKLKDNISLTLEPGFRYYTNSIYQNSEILPSSSGFTLRIGLSYNIK